MRAGGKGRFEMGNYIIRRFMHMVPLILLVIVVNFLLLHAAPGDPVRALLGLGGEYVDPDIIESYRERYGLNRPLPLQLLSYIGRVARGDLGVSYYYKQPVLNVIVERVPRTLLLLIPALCIGVLGGATLGIIAAVRSHTVFDNVTTTAALFTWSLPLFWYAIMLLGLLAVRWDILPSGGMYNLRDPAEGFARYVDLAHHMVLPVFCLALRQFAQIQRLTRSNMLEVLQEQFVMVARSKGLAEKTVIYRHALRNALLPVVTVVGLSIGFLLVGSIITETIFAWPGSGRLLFQSISRRDYPVMLGMLIIVSVAMVIANLVTDLVYGLLDPRIQYE